MEDSVKGLVTKLNSLQNEWKQFNNAISKSQQFYSMFDEWKREIDGLKNLRREITRYWGAMLAKS